MCIATTVGLEVGTFVAGAYGLYRGGLALYRGAKSTLSLEMAATESSSLLRLTESTCVENATIAKQIANGHAFEKHVLTQGEFPGWIRTRDQFAELIENILNSPTAVKQLKNGRTGYWHQESSTVIVLDPKRSDKGTCFQPVKRYKYFDEELR